MFLITRHSQKRRWCAAAQACRVKFSLVRMHSVECFFEVRTDHESLLVRPADRRVQTDLFLPLLPVQCVASTMRAILRDGATFLPQHKQYGLSAKFLSMLLSLHYQFFSSLPPATSDCVSPIGTWANTEKVTNKPKSKQWIALVRITPLLCMALLLVWSW